LILNHTGHKTKNTALKSADIISEQIFHFLLRPYTRVLGLEWIVTPEKPVIAFFSDNRKSDLVLVENMAISNRPDRRWA
jgi:hypothetical protein